MEKNILFPKLNGFVHGGDYNPEQWLDRPDILEEDIRMMKKAGVNCVTLGVFSWSVYEPKEGEFHFEWLKKIMDSLYENGIYTILATPSGARPAWLDKKYPEAMRVGKNGQRNHHGVRHNHCMSSPEYRKKTALMDKLLAEKFGQHPGLIMWHVSNELGGECYCPLCIERFQKYLSEQFDHEIDKLNQAWWTIFWSHRYNDFDQIEPPFANGEGSIMGLNLEWKRFTTWNMNDFMNSEIQVLKEITPDIPVTANFMMLYNGLDYRKMAPFLDVISWDSYPRYNNDYESLYETMTENAFHHAVMRGLKKDKPFMLMESAPGLVNWHPYNKVKRPGVHKLACMQAIACGSDTAQYFQWRKGRGDEFAEKYVAAYEGYERDSYIIQSQVPRFGSGEAKGIINESVRGDDIYILLDVCNYSLTYSLCGHTNHMSPDDHFQDLKRVIAAVGGKARRINVIMPFLYESRQHKRSGRESLDCALGLQELTSMGVENIITFDAHDPRVQNAIPLHGFETIQPAYQFIKNILRNAPDMQLDKDHLMVISPDEGGMGRAIYMANNLGVDMGMFYKRRDYSTIIDGRNPIVAHEFLGADVKGKDMIIIDDMISSGESMLEVAKLLKDREARNIYMCSTFGLFTSGLDKFDKAYEEGLFTKVLTTNVVYQTPELLSREYYISCDLSKYIALIIDKLNHDASISGLLDPADRIQKVIKKFKNHEKI